LAIVGVQRIYGVVGDSLNGITDSLRRQERIRWMHMRNEERAPLPPVRRHTSRASSLCAAGSVVRELAPDQRTL